MTPSRPDLPAASRPGVVRPQHGGECSRQGQYSRSLHRIANDASPGESPARPPVDDAQQRADGAPTLLLCCDEAITRASTSASALVRRIARVCRAGDRDRREDRGVGELGEGRQRRAFERRAAALCRSPPAGFVHGDVGAHPGRDVETLRSIHWIAHHSRWEPGSLRGPRWLRARWRPASRAWPTR